MAFQGGARSGRTFFPPWNASSNQSSVPWSQAYCQIPQGPAPASRPRYGFTNENSVNHYNLGQCSYTMSNSQGQALRDVTNERRPGQNCTSNSHQSGDLGRNAPYSRRRRSYVSADSHRHYPGSCGSPGSIGDGSSHLDNAVNVPIHHRSLSNAHLPSASALPRGSCQTWRQDTTSTSPLDSIMMSSLSPQQLETPEQALSYLLKDLEPNQGSGSHSASLSAGSSPGSYDSSGCLSSVAASSPFHSTGQMSTVHSCSFDSSGQNAGGQLSSVANSLDFYSSGGLSGRRTPGVQNTPGLQSAGRSSSCQPSSVVSPLGFPPSRRNSVGHTPGMQTSAGYCSTGHANSSQPSSAHTTGGFHLSEHNSGQLSSVRNSHGFPLSGQSSGRQLPGIQTTPGFYASGHTNNSQPSSMQTTPGFHSSVQSNSGQPSSVQNTPRFHTSVQSNGGQLPRMQTSAGFHSSVQSNGGQPSSMQSTPGFHTSVQSNGGQLPRMQTSAGFHSSVQSNGGQSSSMQTSAGFHSSVQSNGGQLPRMQASAGFHSSVQSNGGQSSSMQNSPGVPPPELTGGGQMSDVLNSPGFPPCGQNNGGQTPGIQNTPRFHSSSSGNGGQPSSMQTSTGFQSSGHGSNGQSSSMQNTPGFHSSGHGNNGQSSTVQTTPGFHSSVQSNDGQSSSMQNTPGFHSSGHGNNGQSSTVQNTPGFHTSVQSNVCQSSSVQNTPGFHSSVQSNSGQSSSMQNTPGFHSSGHGNNSQPSSMQTTAEFAPPEQSSGSQISGVQGSPDFFSLEQSSIDQLNDPASLGFLSSGENGGGQMSDFQSVAGFPSSGFSDCVTGANSTPGIGEHGSGSRVAGAFPTLGGSSSMNDPGTSNFQSSEVNLDLHSTMDISIEDLNLYVLDSENQASSASSLTADVQLGDMLNTPLSQGDLPLFEPYDPMNLCSVADPLDGCLSATNLPPVTSGQQNFPRPAHSVQDSGAPDRSDGTCKNGLESASSCHVPNGREEDQPFIKFSNDFVNEVISSLENDKAHEFSPSKSPLSSGLTWQPSTSYLSLPQGKNEPTDVKDKWPVPLVASPDQQSFSKAVELPEVHCNPRKRSRATKEPAHTVTSGALQALDMRNTETFTQIKRARSQIAPDSTDGCLGVAYQDYAGAGGLVGKDLIRWSRFNVKFAVEKSCKQSCPQSRPRSAHFPQLSKALSTPAPACAFSANVDVPGLPPRALLARSTSLPLPVSMDPPSLVLEPPSADSTVPSAPCNLQGAPDCGQSGAGQPNPSCQGTRASKRSKRKRTE